MKNKKLIAYIEGAQSNDSEGDFYYQSVTFKVPKDQKVNVRIPPKDTKKRKVYGG